ncbi:MAG: T9SS type A sorting domain-containing protein [Candidatus Marinimicrobia bacterium]|nr:T9SS type A sorting domain-containing protein [Candidatus Neomarinimicrobiota bacterium]MCF7829053.1 T9SS type A sorting domain-containing protein [Candidatus Neomarinimicrobiota bacterium]MCF7881810.1 T9SS type A sorting domain-containing protein [Candidatus Neomarinimicrobiota bacterium]
MFKKLSMVALWSVVGLNCLGLQEVRGQWATDPSNNLRLTPAAESHIYPQVVTDNQGGAYIAYAKYGHDLYMQRVNRFGYIEWDTSISEAPRTQRPEVIIPDKTGGAIVLWRDYSDHEGSITFDYSSNALYAQRIDSAGHTIWAGNGVPVRAYMEPPYTPTLWEAMAPDGQGGAFIAWYDWRSDSDYVYLQHIDQTGNVLLQDDGLPTIPGPDPRIALVDDKNEGVYLIAHSRVSRYSAEGTAVWEAPVMADSAGLSNRAVSDGAQGLIYAGLRLSAESYIGLQRLNLSGEKLWSDVRIPIKHDVHTPSFHLISDGHRGAYVSWETEANYQFLDSTQHIDSTGTVLWSEPIEYFAHAPDCTGGFFGLKPSRELGVDSVDNFYTQCVDPTGMLKWSQPGILTIARENWLRGFGRRQFVPTGDGGTLLFWDEREPVSNLFGIYGQQINHKGELGHVITRINQQKTSIPTGTVLYESYPNPFNSQTQIQYHLASTQLVHLAIYNIRGELISVLVNQQQGPGDYRYQWSGSHNNGREVSTGIYLCRLVTKTQAIATKIVLLR